MSTMSQNTTTSTITESTILTSYLLHPSPLPTVLPYSVFLNLVPTTYKNNPDHTDPLKRLYRDLQFQRAITVEHVRDNIERECGAKAVGLRARLARQIAIEEGDREAEAEEEVLRRKRRRVGLDYEGRDGEEAQIKEEDVSDEVDEFNDPLQLAAHQTLYDHASSLHPAAHVLPLLPNLDRDRSSSASAFHTKESLLGAMENASGSLEREIEELEAECARVRGSIAETVGGLSDLRYGRRHRDSEATEGGHQFADVLEAIGDFRELVRNKTTA